MPIGCVTLGSIVAAPPIADKTHQSHPRFPRSARRVEQVRLNEWFVRNAAAVPAQKLELERAQFLWALSLFGFIFSSSSLGPVVMKDSPSLLSP